MRQTTTAPRQTTATTTDPDRHRMTAVNAGPVQVDHITALVCQVRPDWPAWQVKSVLQSHAGQVHLADLAVAALRAAQSPTLQTPRAIGWRGPHWDGATTLPPAIAPRARCGVCGKTEDRCAIDRPGPDDHTFEPAARLT